MIKQLLSRMARAWHTWVLVIMRREDPRFLALFRIGIGLSVLFVVGSAVVYDVVDAMWLDRAYGGYLDLKGGTFLIAFFGGAKPAVVWTFIVLSLLSGLCVVCGLFGKVAAFIALQTTMALLKLNPYAAGGSATLLLTNALWLLVLSRASTTWSLDCFIRNRSFSTDEQIPAWPRYLAIFQILICYWTTGLQKVSIHWVPFGDLSALYYILQQPSWQRFDHSWAAFVYPLTQATTLIVWLWEIGAPLWGISLFLHATTTRILLKRAAKLVRHTFFFLGIGLHLMVFILMDIGVFSLVCLAFYPCLLTLTDLKKLNPYRTVGA